MIQAGLIAGDTDVDLISLARRGLIDEGGIGQQRPRHRNHIGLATGDDVLTDLRVVNAVGGDDRYRQLGLHPVGDIHKGRAGDGRDDGRNPRLMPADARIDQRGPCGLDGLALIDDLVPGIAALDQVQHGQAVDDDEVLADRLADMLDHLHRQPTTILHRPTPFILALVGAGAGELIQKIALAGHDLHAVVAGLFRQLGRAGVGLDLTPDAPGRQSPRAEWIDRGLGAGRRDRQRVVAVAPGMQQLQADLAALLMHRIGDLTVAPQLAA